LDIDTSLGNSRGGQTALFEDITSGLQMKGSNKPVRQPKKRFKSMYRIHKYWGRKPWYVVKEYIKHYSQPGGKVFDPFGGSGIVAFEGAMLGRYVIINDLNPFATFLIEMTARYVDLNEFKKEFERIKREVKDEINDLYVLDTKCPRCGSILIAKSTAHNMDTGKVLVIEYCESCRSKVRERPMKTPERDRIDRIEVNSIPYWYPKTKLYQRGDMRATSVPDLFTPRNLLAVSMIYDQIGKIRDGDLRDLMKLVFTSFIVQATKMVYDCRNMKSGTATGWTQLGYGIPTRYRELNAWYYFETRFEKVLRGKKQTNELLGPNPQIAILNQSATNFPNIEDESIDYVLTDPPYGASVPYFSLSHLWCAWLRKDIRFDDEILEFDNFEENLTKVFKEMHRILKTNKCLSVMFNTRKIEVWTALLRAIKSNGFELVDAIPQKPIALSVAQTNGRGNLVHDFILTFKKTGPKKHVKKRSFTSIEELVVEVGERIIKKKGAASLNDIYLEVIPLAIKNDLFNEQRDIIKILNKHFHKEDGYIVRGKR